MLGASQGVSKRVLRGGGGTLPGITKIGGWVKITPGYGPQVVHVSIFHLGYLFLTHTRINYLAGGATYSSLPLGGWMRQVPASCFLAPEVSGPVQ